jgi:ketosteroid isomerase-like protein
VDARAAARAWVAAWEQAWPVGDVERVAPVYADGCLFYSHPFREPEVPRDYVVWAFAEQTSAECRFGEPVVDGDRAAVDWWAVMTGSAEDGSEETIAGTSLLRFDAAGLVVEQRDVWALEPGRRDLPDWAREGRS